MLSSSYVIPVLVILISPAVHATKDILEVMPLGYEQGTWAHACSRMGYEHLPSSLFPLSAEKIRTFKHPNEWINTAYFNNAGTKILTTTYNKQAYIWDIATSELNTSITLDCLTTSARFDYTDRYILTQSHEPNIRIWDAASGKALHILKHDAMVTCAHFSCDGKQVISGSIDKTVRIWDTASGKELQKLPHNSRINSARFSFDGKLAITCTNDTHACVWDIETGKKLYSLIHPTTVTSCRFNKPGSLILTAAGNSLYIWDTATKNRLYQLKHEGDVYISCFSYNDTMILSSAQGDKALFLWDPKTGSLINHFNYKAKTIHSVDFSRDDSKLNLINNTVLDIWDTRTGILLYQIIHEDEITSATFSPDANHLVSSCMQDDVYIWDLSLAKSVAITNLSHAQYILLHLIDKEFKRSNSVSFATIAEQEDLSLKQLYAVFTQFDEKVRTFLIARYAITTHTPVTPLRDPMNEELSQPFFIHLQSNGITLSYDGALMRTIFF